MNTVKEYKGYKVPDGATHYDEAHGVTIAAFAKLDDEGEWLWWVARGDHSWGYGSDANNIVELPQEPEAYMPKVGDSCEYTAIRDGDGQYSSILAGTWYECTKIIAFHDGCVWTSDNGIRPLKNTIFRPIKTKREKVIGWHLVDMGYDSEEFNFMAAEESLVFVTLSSLFEGGHLVIPESKQ